MKESEKSKIIFFVTQGDRDHPSSRIRAINYFKYIRNAGYSVIHNKRVGINAEKKTWSEKIIFISYKWSNFIRRPLQLLFFNYDILFIQRAFLTPLERFIVASKKNLQVIYDVDDGIFLGSLSNEINFLKMLDLADNVILSTPELVKFVHQHSNTKTNIILSSVDTERVIVSKTSDKFIIGWSGSNSTSKYLREINEIIFELLEKYDYVEFHYICDVPIPFLNHPKCKFHCWQEHTEQEIISTFHIGIMPLENDEWSKYKGGYKLFLYLAAGIPVIASPVGINKEIVKSDTNGLLALGKNEWMIKMNRMIIDKALYDKTRKYVQNMDKTSFDLPNNAIVLLNLIKSMK